MHPDDQFHPPTSADPFWTETCWFTFAVPERRLSGQLYPFFRPNQGVTSSGCYIWNEHGALPWNCLYGKNHWHIQMPDKLEDFTLPTGLSYKCVEPLKRYDLHYLDPDEGYAEVTLTFEAICPPNYLGESHLDQPGRYRGTIRLGDQVVDVDAYGMRDRSWGPRSQIGAKLGGHSERGGYSYGTASDTDAFHVLSMEHGGDVLPIHGYYMRDGEYARLKQGVGRRAVLERHAELGCPTRVLLEATDELGRELRAEGRCVNHIGVHLNPNLFTWNALTEWQFGDAVGWGEDHDNWSASTAREFFRKQLQLPDFA